MKTLMTTLVVAIFAMVSATAVMAADMDNVPAQFLAAKKAVELTGLNIKNFNPDKDAMGRAALVLESADSVDVIVTRFLRAHSDGEVLAGSLVTGMAHMPKNDQWNITLRDGAAVTVVSITKLGAGSKIMLRNPLDSDINKLNF